MMELGQLVEIVFSKALKDFGLEELCGWTGIVVEDLSGLERKNPGYMVLFSEAYEDEFCWFIPAKSVVDGGTV